MKRGKIHITVFILLLLHGNLFSQINEEIIVLETQTGKIEGTILYPSSTVSIPIVLIIAGSGPTDRDGNNPVMKNNSLKMLAEGFSENKIASLRFDKRGIGKSTNAGVEEKDLRFETYINDVKLWIDLLNKDERFSDIIVLGHSEGSLIGMIASQKGEVSKFISVAGVGMPAGKLIREQLKAQPTIYNPSLPIIKKLEKGKTVENIPQMLYVLFRPSVQPYMISWFKYNPQKEIAKLEKPILLVQGTTDIQVDVDHAQKLAKANKRAELVILEGMNHILKEAELDRTKNLQTYSIPDLPLAEDLIEALVEFVKD